MLIAAAVLLSLAAIPVSANPRYHGREANDHLGNIPHTSASITINGVKDAAYNNALVIQIGPDPETEAASSAIALVHLLWTPGYLYVFGEVTDAHVVEADMDTILGTPWSGDNLTMIFNPDGEGIDTRLYRMVPAHGGFPSMDERINRDPNNTNAFVGRDEVGDRFDLAGVITATGWNVEARFPLFGAGANDTVKLNFQFADDALHAVTGDNHRGQYQLVQGLANARDVMNFATFTLAEAPPPPPPAAAVADTAAPAADAAPTPAPAQQAPVRAPGTFDPALTSVVVAAVALGGIILLAKRRRKN
jgi:hypothetical protein